MQILESQEESPDFKNPQNHLISRWCPGFGTELSICWIDEGPNIDIVEYNPHGTCLALTPQIACMTLVLANESTPTNNLR